MKENSFCFCAKFRILLPYSDRKNRLSHADPLANLNLTEIIQNLIGVENRFILFIAVLFIFLR